MRHSAIMGVIAVACVVAVVDSAMLGPTGRLHHGGGLGKANERNTRVMGMGFIDDESDEPPPVLELAQLALGAGGLAALPGTVSDTSADESFSPPAAPTGFGRPAFGLGALALPHAGAPAPPPRPPAPPAPPPEPAPKASPLTPISLLQPATKPPVTPEPPPVTPGPPPVTPPVVVPVIFTPPPPPPIEPPAPRFVRPGPIAAAPLPLPEPTTWTMMLLGCGLAAVALRRRRRPAGVPA